MLNRREFLCLVASGVAIETLLPMCEASMRSGLLAEVDQSARAPFGRQAFGSGHFGYWMQDEFGLPAYCYTCDQDKDPKARTPVDPEWRSPTDQTHQVGNDRIIAAVSNYGYAQVRQDEGAPKFLNDLKPDEKRFGAGIGYLTDGKTALSTFYPGTGTGFDRHFGMGYFRKRVSTEHYSADQVIFAPFGDDPVLISQVTIANHSAVAADLRWTEYWGCEMYQFSFRSYMEGFVASGEVPGLDNPVRPTRIPERRREFAKRFTHRFETIEQGQGILETKQFLGRTSEEEQAWAKLQELMAKYPARQLGPPVKYPSPNTHMDDTRPPATFLLSLDGPADRFFTNADAFFGQGGALRPDGLFHGETTDLSASGPESALILEKRLHLGPGETRTLHFLYGYIPEGFSVENLFAKYRQRPEAHLAESCERWKNEGVQLQVEGEPWVRREMMWHNYYLRSGFTYDDFFDEHIVSQGMAYQYQIGFQGASRDPLQHALPLVFGESDLAKQVLRYTLKSQQKDGTLPYALVGHGMPMPNFFLPSDLDLWVLWFASEYVLGTRDVAFLDEEIPTYPLGSEARKMSVRQSLDRSYRHLVDTIGTGKHGLLRGLNDDWNDSVYWRGVPEKFRSEIGRESESMLNAAMAAYVLDQYARMLRSAGETVAADDAQKRAEQQRIAVRAQWTGRWFKRLWYGPSLGWLGEDRMWLEPQPWAIVGGVPSPEQTRILVAAMDETLRKPSPIGAKQVSKKVEWPNVLPGALDNGGVWAALTGTLIWALARTDGAMAWDEWKKNTRANQAEVYPDYWYGIWSGPDVFCSIDSPNHAGQALNGIEWPVMCMHQHAWPIYSAAKLMGVEFTEYGVDLEPTLPKDTYSFQSRLLGLKKSRSGYEGWYAPKNAGNWKVRVKLGKEASRFQELIVNGTRRQATSTPEGIIEFYGVSSPDRALRWELQATY